MFITQWHRSNVWLAMRIYVFVIWAAARLERLKLTADHLVRLHTEDPQARLPLGDEDLPTAEEVRGILKGYERDAHC